MTPAVEKAREFATTHHGEQRYGSRPYTFHLAAVGKVLTRFGYEMTRDGSTERLHMGAWLHDVIEDTPATVGCVKQAFGAELALLVHAVTDEPGPTREIRKLRTYPKIRRHSQDAVILKVADRIANVESSRVHAPRLFVRYQAEQQEFCRQLYRSGECDDMWFALSGLLQYGAPRSTSEWLLEARP